MKSLLFPVLSTIIGLTFLAEQDVPHIHSTKAVADDYRDILAIRQTHSFQELPAGRVPPLVVGTYDITPGPENGILLIDFGEGVIHLITAQRGVIRTYGNGEGGGPGELSRPTGTAWDGKDRVYISEYGNLRISVFDVDGTFLNIIRPEHRPNEMIVMQTGELWIGQVYSRYSTDRAWIYDLDSGEWTNEIGGRYNDAPYLAGRSGYYRGYPHLAILEHSVLVAPSYPYELLRYSADGELRQIISRRARWYTQPEPPPDGMPLWRSNGGGLLDLATSPDGMIYVLFSLKEVRGETVRVTGYILDVFETDGRWLTTIPMSDLDIHSRIATITVSTDGALWVSHEDDVVSRFELERIEDQFN